MSEPSPGPASIAALEAEGELVVERGQFTLDTAAARARLADFRVADPHTYVLLVVEAANLLPGVTELRADISNRATWLQIYGVGLQPGELDALFDAGLDGRGLSSARDQARSRLAAACHIAAGLEGRRVELRSGDQVLELHGDETTRKDATEPVRELSEDAPAATELIELYVEDTRATAILTAEAGEREFELLQTEACFSSVPIRFHDLRLDRGFELLGHANVVDLPRPVERGKIGWDPLGKRTGLFLVASGVTIEHLFEDDWNYCVTAIVDASHLRRDLSLRRFVHDEAFDELVAAAQAAHDAFELDALELPALAGGLEYPKAEWLRRCVGPLALATLLTFAPAAGLEAMAGNGRIEPVGYGILLVSALLGLLFFVRGITFIQQTRSSQMHPDKLGPPGVARVESKPVIREQIGPVSAVSFRVLVIPPIKGPYEATLDVHLASDRLATLEPGQWIWVHLAGGDYGELYFDRELSADRPPRALALAATARRAAEAVEG